MPEWKSRFFYARLMTKRKVRVSPIGGRRGCPNLSLRRTSCYTGGVGVFFAWSGEGEEKKKRLRKMPRLSTKEELVRKEGADLHMAVALSPEVAPITMFEAPAEPGHSRMTGSAPADPSKGISDTIKRMRAMMSMGSPEVEKEKTMTSLVVWWEQILQWTIVDDG
ncbi:hypothetical protein ACLOJK_001007 [Asimina triloba]